MGKNDEKKGKNKPFSCANPSGTIINTYPNETEIKIETKEELMEIAAVTKMAPDFEVPAYFEGGFKNIKLSDSIGKWVVLCFYPGDFTFV